MDRAEKYMIVRSLIAIALTIAACAFFFTAYADANNLSRGMNLQEEGMGRRPAFSGDLNNCLMISLTRWDGILTDIDCPMPNTRKNRIKLKRVFK